MAEITTQMIKELREKTGAGIVDCKKALQEAGGDIEKAVEILRKKGAAKAAKKAERATAEGAVFSYIHAGGKVGVLVELNCETDFVARNETFKELGHEIAMQIAAMAPEFVSREDVPAELVEKEKEILKQQALAEGKPEHIVEKIVEGRLNKFYSEKCLLEQPWIKDDSKTIKDLITDYITKLGENIKVRRFARFEVGKYPTGGFLPPFRYNTEQPLIRQGRWGLSTSGYS